MENRTRTYVEEFLNFKDASNWLDAYNDEYLEHKNVWEITQCALVLRGNKFQCTFSVSNQKAMT
jgi:hypothetical protein